MQKSATLAEIAADLARNPQCAFHSSLSLYALVEKRPKPGQPDWGEVGCIKKDSADGMLVYLSPLDALLDAKSRNRSGGQFRVYPFEAIDPRPYIMEHEGWFTVYVGYGFAARGKHLVVGARGDVQALIMGVHFRIMPTEFEHFHINFSDAMIDKINAFHRAANMHDYGRVVEELAECTSAELERQAQEATQKIKQAIIGNETDANVTHCALYDPVEQKWRFAAFADVAD